MIVTEAAHTTKINTKRQMRTRGHQTIMITEELMENGIRKSIELGSMDTNGTSLHPINSCSGVASQSFLKIYTNSGTSKCLTDSERSLMRNRRNNLREFIQ